MKSSEVNMAEGCGKAGWQVHSVYTLFSTLLRMLEILYNFKIVKKINERMIKG